MRIPTTLEDITLFTSIIFHQVLFLTSLQVYDDVKTYKKHDIVICKETNRMINSLYKRNLLNPIFQLCKYLSFVIISKLDYSAYSSQYMW